jgi:hypothetical protein
MLINLQNGTIKIISVFQFNMFDKSLFLFAGSKLDVLN